MNYLELLENSFLQDNSNLHPTERHPSRLEFLANAVFDFTTYDSSMSVLFATKAVEVIAAISNKATFAYQEVGAENYQWYLIMVNMPFFQDRLNWGSSIRGAWWDGKQPSIDSCGLYVEDEQLRELKFADKNYMQSDQLSEFEQFAQALVEFAKPEMNQA
jgi:hypothetical protein